MTPQDQHPLAKLADWLFQECVIDGGSVDGGEVQEFLESIGYIRCREAEA